MNLQEFSARHFRPNRPHGMDLQESSVLFGLGGTLGRSSTTQRPPLGHGVVGGGLGGTPLAARPPASGHWHRGMDLQESSAAQVPQVRAP